MVAERPVLWTRALPTPEVSTMPSDAHSGWVCEGCGKHVTGSMPVDQCADCGGRWFEATPERLACDRCGDADASRVFNSEHDRLCTDCIDWENRDNPACPECERRMLPATDDADVAAAREETYEVIGIDAE
jgi:Zn finger protein HypA/HybF involved in hydrogenase expression